MFRIVIADSDEVLTRRLVDGFSRVPGLEVVGTAVDGFRALDVVLHTQPHVVVLDPALPALGDLAPVVGAIKRSSGGARVVVRSGRDREATAQLAFASGADGLLTSDGPAEHLPTTLRWFATEEDPDFGGSGSSAPARRPVLVGV